MASGSEFPGNTEKLQRRGEAFWTIPLFAPGFILVGVLALIVVRLLLGLV